jgi:MFS family permease
MAMNAVQIIVSFTGAMFVDRLGRRPMLIWVNIGCALCWVGVVASAGIQASKHDKASSAACVAMIYIFQAVYSFGWTPMQALYPVEVLSFEMRAKGMAFSNMFVTAGTLVNQFGFPVALDNIKWKTYFVFMVWCVCQAGIIYVLVPETKNRTVSLDNPRLDLTDTNTLFSSRNLTASSVLRTLLRSLSVRRSLNLMQTLMSLVSPRMVMTEHRFTLDAFKKGHRLFHVRYSSGGKVLMLEASVPCMSL